MHEYGDLWPKRVGRHGILYNFNFVMCVYLYTWSIASTVHSMNNITFEVLLLAFFPCIGNGRYLTDLHDREVWGSSPTRSVVLCVHFCVLFVTITRFVSHKRLLNS